MRAAAEDIEEGPQEVGQGGPTGSIQMLVPRRRNDRTLPKQRGVSVPAIVHATETGWDLVRRTDFKTFHVDCIMLSHEKTDFAMAKAPCANSRLSSVDCINCSMASAIATAFFGGHNTAFFRC